MKEHKEIYMRKTLFGPALMAVLTVSTIGSAASIPSGSGGSCCGNRVSLEITLPLHEIDSVRLHDEERAFTEGLEELLRLAQALQVLGGDGVFVGAAALFDASEAGFDGGGQDHDEIRLQHVSCERGEELVVDCDLGVVVCQVGEGLCTQ
jgi:hypothetical protein